MSTILRESSDRHSYTIVGAGAIGGTLGWHLAKAGHHVVLIDRDADHVKAIRQDGLTLLRDGVARTQRVAAALTPEEFQGKMERVLLAVKADAASDAARWIAPYLAPDGYVVSVQNGLNEAVIARYVGEERTIGAFVDLFADVVGPGLIKDGGPGALAIGELSGTISQRVRALVDDLQALGPALATTNVAGFLWSKLGFGAMLISTALCDAPMSQLLDRHRATAHALAAEVFAVANVLSIELEPFDAFEPTAYLLNSNAADRDAATDRAVAWLATQSKDRSGVWRDIAVRRRATEVPTHYAPVLALADEHRIPVPVLRRMLKELAEVEAAPESMSEDRLAALDQLAESTA